MQEREESKSEMDTGEDMQTENQKLKQTIAEYQIQTLLSNQRQFNEWILTSLYPEILKLKEGLNQLIDLANESSEESEQAEVNEDEDKDKARVKEIAEKKVQLEQLEKKLKEIKEKKK